MLQPTYDDVNLILRLYEQRREPVMREARFWFATKFKADTFEELMQLCPLGSQENQYFRQVTSYWEMVASFITGGVLNHHLFFQSGQEMLLAWEKVKNLAPHMRTARKNPLVWKNLEEAAKLFAEHLNSHGSPDAYPTVAELVRNMVR